MENSNYFISSWLSADLASPKSFCALKDGEAITDPTDTEHLMNLGLSNIGIAFSNSEVKTKNGHDLVCLQSDSPKFEQWAMANNHLYERSSSGELTVFLAVNDASKIPSSFKVQDGLIKVFSSYGTKDVLLTGKGISRHRLSDKPIHLAQEMGKIGGNVNAPQIGFVSGYGQFHTNEADPNKPHKKLTPYTTVTPNEIIELVKKPSNVAKKEARWLIPSTLPSRVFATQSIKGQFHLLWIDLDKNAPQLAVVDQILHDEVGGQYLIYNTSSATQENPKSRALVFLDKPLSGGDWVLAQQVFIELLASKGIEVDPRVQEPAQLCYLPNRPNANSHYEYIVRMEGDYFDPLRAWGVQIDLKRSERLKSKQDMQELKSLAQERRKSLKKSDKGLIDCFNDFYTVEELLLKAGYAQWEHDPTHFMHPHSESQSFSAHVKNGRVYTLSPNDPLYTADKSNGAHDAFSAFEVLFHGGDRNSALQDAGARWLSIDGEPFNTVRQREWKEDQKSLAVGSTNKPMEKLMQMKVTKDIVEHIEDAKFIYRNLIVQAHLIAICSQGNGGKTTIFVHISAELAREGFNVIYVNADASAPDLKRYLDHAEQNGYTLINPDLTNGSPEMVIDSLKGLSQQKDADLINTVLILDTLKKFADLMSKSKAKEFNSILRSLTSKGMTVICLSHTNKYNDKDGKPVFEGTGDLRNDFDELIYLLPVKNPDGTLTVSTEADKVRAKIVNMTFTLFPDGKVKVNDEYIDTSAIATYQKHLEEDELLIQFIQEQICFTSKSPTELIQISKDQKLGFSQRKIYQVLKRYSNGISPDPKWLAMPAPNFGNRYGLIDDDFKKSALGAKLK
jgi:hypothetical protein